ncbi:MFS transporter [Streptomyces sp. NPDC002787]
MAGIALGQLVIGPLSDTLGRRRPLFTGLSVYVVAGALCALAPHPAALIGMRLFHRSRVPRRRRREDAHRHARP